MIDETLDHIVDSCKGISLVLILEKIISSLSHFQYNYIMFFSESFGCCTLIMSKSISWVKEFS